MGTKRRLSISSSTANTGECSTKKRRWGSKKDLVQFERQPTDQHHDQHLCATCRKLDVKAVQALDGKNLGNHGVPVFSFKLGISALHSNCAMCKMLATMIFECRSNRRFTESAQARFQKESEHDYHLRAFDKETFFRRTTRYKDPSVSCKEPVLVVYDGRAKKRAGENGVGDYQIQRGFIQASEHNPNESQRKSFLLKDPQGLASLQWVRQAIDECQAGHICRPLDFKFPWSARVIDCQTRRIVRLTKGQKYLALSYVWGDYHKKRAKKNLTAYQKAASSTFQLPARLPATIEDALELSLSLGYRYLWVDRYCIKQYHSSDKKKQIKQMSNIYAWAVATICATGTDDRTGIYGVSLPIKPYTTHSQGLRLEWSQRSLKNHIWRSEWLSRGWTLQESVLSSRCLFFTPDGPIVACKAGVFNECTVQYRPVSLIERFFSRETFLFNQGYDLEYYGYQYVKRRRLPQRFSLLRQQYTKRSLGYDSDALTAFQAILSTIGAPSYWGIPTFPEIDAIMLGVHGVFGKDVKLFLDNPSDTPLRQPFQGLKLEQQFIVNLQWMVRPGQKGYSRCKGLIPSWSWATQSTEVIDPPESLLRFHKPTSDDFWARLYVRHPGEQFVRLKKLLGSASSIIEPKSHDLFICSVLARWKHTGVAGREGSVKVRLTWTSNTEWKQLLPLYRGEAVFDNPPAHALGAGCPTKNRNTCGDGGYAILLHMKPRLNELAGAGVWLLIEAQKRGDYRRKGLLMWPPAPFDGTEPSCRSIDAPKSALKAIILR